MISSPLNVPPASSACMHSAAVVEAGVTCGLSALSCWFLGQQLHAAPCTSRVSPTQCPVHRAAGASSLSSTHRLCWVEGAAHDASVDVDQPVWPPAAVTAAGPQVRQVPGGDGTRYAAPAADVIPASSNSGVFRTCAHTHVSKWSQRFPFSICRSVVHPLPPSPAKRCCQGLARLAPRQRRHLQPVRVGTAEHALPAAVAAQQVAA